MSTALDLIKKEAEAAANKYNVALKAENMRDMTAAEAELVKAEEKYAETSMLEEFTKCRKADNPMIAAVYQYDYYILTHKVVKQNGIPLALELDDTRTKQLDLVKFSKFCGLPMTWAYRVEKFNQLMALRAAKELKISDMEIKNIVDSFYMDELAKKIEMGGTPTSNNQICKQLQMVIDGFCFTPDVDGSNIYKVNSHDVAYLVMCYTRRGKQALTVAVAKNAFLHRLVMDVAHRLVTGKVYGLQYQQIRKPVVAAPVAANDPDKKVSLKKPEKASSAPEVASETAPESAPEAAPAAAQEA